MGSFEIPTRYSNEASSSKTTGQGFYTFPLWLFDHGDPHSTDHMSREKHTVREAVFEYVLGFSVVSKDRTKRPSALGPIYVIHYVRLPVP